MDPHLNNYRGNKGRWRGRGRNNQYQVRCTQDSSKRNITPFHQKWNTNKIKQLENGKGLPNKPPKGHRCGMERHWSRTCRMLRHLANLYQVSIKERKIN